jgi:predicted transcriptional regulator
MVFIVLEPAGCMENRLIFKIYGSSPNTKMLDFLLSFPKNEFTVSDIIQELGMSKTTFYKYFDVLLNIGIVKINKEITKPKLYSINLASPIVQNVRKNIDFVSEKIADDESMKIKIKPLELKSMELEGIQEHIQYLQRLQRQTKLEIKKLEPIKN